MSKGLLAVIRFIHEVTGQLLEKYKDVPSTPIEDDPETPITGTSWERYIEALKGSVSVPEKLKVAVLAQAILESGRGTSELARIYFNFHGLKWRDEMLGYAEPVRYAAHDGVDDYCRFAAPEMEPAGYMKFIGRSPYVGWEKYKQDPYGFIQHIQDAGYATGSNYVAKVTALFAEAYELLGETPKTPKPPKATGRLAVVVGHSRASDGAQAVAPLSQGEYAYNTDIAKRMQAYAETRGVELDIFTRDSGGIAGAYNLVEAMSPDACMELHFNAATSTARGSEVLYSDDRDKAGVGEKAFGQIVLDAIEVVFGRTGRERHTPLLELGAVDKGRGYSNLNQVFSFPSIIVEPFFGSNKADATLGQAKRQAYAECLVEAFIQWKA